MAPLYCAFVPVSSLRRGAVVRQEERELEWRAEQRNEVLFAFSLSLLSLQVSSGSFSTSHVFPKVPTRVAGSREL